MELTDKQNIALNIAVQRYKNHEKYTVIAGYAGSGKTSLIKYIVAALQVPEELVCYATYTGKAAQVLMKKGNHNISTLHKLLYDSVRKADGKFIHRPKPSIIYRVIVADECSMIPKDMVRLLLSHQCYVIFLGDPFQLPPVNPEETNDLLEHPHIFLDEVLRQQQENEIIRVTMDIRAGKPLTRFDGHDVKIYNRRDLVDGMYTWADQILVGTNKTRIAINNEMRKKAGFGPEPEPGDKLIILKNNWDIVADNEEPLVNGTIGFLGDGYKTFFRYPYYINGGGTVDLYKGEFVSETGGDFGMLSMDYKLLVEGEKGLDWKTEYALSKNPKFSSSVPLEEVAYGYAITVHKAQGSQWDKVLVLEESFPFSKQEHARWLYTACTRAADKLVLIKKE